MTKKFDVNMARKTTAKAIVKKSPEIDDNSIQNSRFYREYYDLETGQPISFEVISNRIKRRFLEMDRLSVLAMLDLYFVHQNWKTFYNRQESFKKYVSEELKISRCHAYGILNAVSLLQHYFEEYKGKNVYHGDTHFINDIAKVLDDIGIKKLRTLTAMKDKTVKYEILDRLITGESISTDEISQMNKKVKQAVIGDIGNIVLENGSSVLFDRKEILKFMTTNSILRKEVVKAVRRYYSGSKT